MRNSSVLASRFGKVKSSFRSDRPLLDEEIRRVAPSVFAEAKHESRSTRYSYIPTSEVINSLRKEGFQPFSVVQSRVRDDGKREHTKHMLRLRHVEHIASTEGTNEIILLNSHDGTSSYQMLAGQYRFVCHNGIVCGDTLNDIRIPHKGDVIGKVIEGAYTVLDQFDAIKGSTEGMRTLSLSAPEQAIFARAALTLKYDDEEIAPITEQQLLEPRRFEDRGNDLWRTFNRVQENIIQGGLRGRTSNGKRTTTRAVTGIDQNVKINRALWILAEEMGRLKVKVA